MPSTDEWSKGSYTGHITTFQLTAATSSKIFHNFFLDLIFEYLIWRTNIDNLMLGKCNPLSQLREHDAKIQITYAEHYNESDSLFLNEYF